MMEQATDAPSLTDVRLVPLECKKDPYLGLVKKQGLNFGVLTEDWQKGHFRTPGNRLESAAQERH
jgi:hypothetical protein